LFNLPKLKVRIPKQILQGFQDNLSVDATYQFIQADNLRRVEGQDQNNHRAGEFVFELLTQA